MHMVNMIFFFIIIFQMQNMETYQGLYCLPHIQQFPDTSTGSIMDQELIICYLNGLIQLLGNV